MRNILEFPITRTEIVDSLRELADEIQKEDSQDGVCGDIRPILLKIAAQIVHISPVDISRLLDPIES